MTLKGKRCQGSPHMLLLGGPLSSLRVTSVPRGSLVLTYPMTPVNCTGYECQTCSHTVIHLNSIHPLKQLTNPIVAINTVTTNLSKH